MDDRRPEETLDPADWEEMRALGHRMVDEMLEHLRTVRDRPVWQPVPLEARERLTRPVPQEPEGAGRAYEDFLRDVRPYPMGNIHPRFWGWVMGNGTPLAALADMLASAMNSNMGGGDHGAACVEHQVLAWWREIMGFPPDASGLLVSGGSVANLVGLAVARNVRAGFDVRKEGLAGRPRLVVYASSETHSSNAKAVELLGLGAGGLRTIPVNDAYEMDVAELSRAVAADRAAGRVPLAVVANAGTVNTGAIDDLAALADLCARERLWLHVDGAFGALAVLDPRIAPRLAGMERADSLAFDLHKWMYLPFEVGCVLVRREEEHRRAFSLTPEYLSHATRGLASGEVWFSDYGIQLTRGFRALKVWMSLKEHGLAKHARLVAQNVDQARHLDALVQAEPELELMAPTPLNVVNFRYRGRGRTDAELDALNEEIVLSMQESGFAVPSSTTLRGRYTIRVAFTNHRTRREDVEALAREVVRLGRKLGG